MTDLFKGFGVNIAKEINSGLGPGIPAVTLIRRIAGTPSSTDLTAGAPITENSHVCKGFLDTFDSKRFGNSAIQQGSRVVVILGDSLPTGVIPQTEDRIIAEGSTFHIHEVMRDPAAATYTCEVRK